MATSLSPSVLADHIGSSDRASLWIKRAVLVVIGVAALAIAAKIRVPMWPVPATMQTFAVLSIGAAYGLRLGLVTLLGYVLVGALGFDVFTSSSAEHNGLSYMMGATGGYLVGFVVAGGIMGALARQGWDKSFGKMVLAMLIGNIVIYAFGLAWMAHLFLAVKGAVWVMQWGMINFLPFDAVKLVLAAMLFPAMWRLVGKARS